MLSQRPNRLEALVKALTEIERAGIIEYVVHAIEPDEIFWFPEDQSGSALKLAERRIRSAKLAITELSRRESPERPFIARLARVFHHEALSLRLLPKQPPRTPNHSRSANCPRTF